MRNRVINCHVPSYGYNNSGILSSRTRSKCSMVEFPNVYKSHRLSSRDHRRQARKLPKG
jgi:hypothetical protein